MQDELLRLQADLQKPWFFALTLMRLYAWGSYGVMNRGIFVQEGTPRDIVMNPVDEYVQRFVHDERQVALLTGKWLKQG